MKDAEQNCCCAGSHAAIRIRNLNVKIGAVSILENIAEMNPALANNGFFKIFESVIHSGEND